MEKLQISTTQNVDIDYQLASVGDRIFAHLLDLVIKGSFMLIVYLILQYTIGTEEWWFSLFYLPIYFYNLLCDLFLNGQTFGKMLMKIKVIRTNGGELSFGICFIRWIFRLVDFLFTFGTAGLLTVIINGKGQRIGDLAAGTTVLKINAKGDLNETAYMELEEGYQPTYPDVIKLSDTDLQTIKEVILIAEKTNQYSEIGAPHPLALKTKDVVLNKLAIQTKQPASEFLTTILKDYNYYHQ